MSIPKSVTKNSLSKINRAGPVHTYPDIFKSATFSFRVHTYHIQIEFARPHASDGIRIHCSTQGSSAINCVRSMRHEACDSGALLLQLYRHIGLLFGKRLDTNFLRHRIRKYPDSPVHTLSDSLQVFFFIYLFPLWRGNLKTSGIAV